MGDSMQFNTSVTFEGVEPGKAVVRLVSVKVRDLSTSVTFEGIEPDEIVVRLVSIKARDLRHIRRELSACRVSVFTKPREGRQKKGYRARLSLHLVAESGSECLYPPHLELHASDGALVTAIEKAFVKAHELLVPRREPPVRR